MSLVNHYAEQTRDMPWTHAVRAQAPVIADLEEAVRLLREHPFMVAPAQCTLPDCEVCAFLARIQEASR